MNRRLARFGRKAVILVFVAVTALPVAALDYFAEGERLFADNKPAEAIPLLFQASQARGTDPRVFLHLGICYAQVGKNDEAISTFMKGTSVPGADRKRLFYNAGEVYYLVGSWAEATTMYSRAIGIDSAFAPAFLGRANARGKLGQFAEAVSDYSTYLTLDPATWQKDSIQRLMNLLTGAVQAQKDAALKAEAEKAATEAEKQAQAERYRKLMDDVSASLQAVDGASTLSAGSEGVEQYNEEGQLE